MKRQILYKAGSGDVTLALECGVDGLLVSASLVPQVSGLARCVVRDEADFPSLLLTCKEDEVFYAESLIAGKNMVLALGWEILPVENLLADPNPQVAQNVAVEVASLQDAVLACGILEHGVSTLVVLPQALPQLRDIVERVHGQEAALSLQKAKISTIRTVGMGHRVCVDTLSVLQRGQGMLVGNSSAFTFLVHAETEHNAYVAARPFRVNAGAVHCYALMPEDKTRYLEEIHTGDEVLVYTAKGEARRVTVGRVKVEARPMLYIEAENQMGKGGVFLQNAETIRLVRPDGSSVSVVDLNPGDEILCHCDAAGRHFGMRVQEDIQEN